MIRPNFTREQVADLEAFERHIQNLFSIIPRDGSAVDLQELFFRFTIDSATEFLFGKSVHSLRMTAEGGPSQATFAEAFNVAQHSVTMRSRLGILRNVYKDRKGMEAIRICHEYVDQFVDEALRYREKLDLEEKAEVVKEEKYVFLYELAKATKDKRRLRDELMNVLLAGRDTTASLLSNLWFMLAKRPDVFAKLRREVEETLHGELPRYSQLRNMKYLKYCLNECKYPIPSTTISPPPNLRETSKSTSELITASSPPPPPRRARKLPPRHPRHRSPHRRRATPKRPSLRAKRHNRSLHNLRHAPSYGLLRPRRRDLQARALGTAEARMGVSAI